jgi:hypothetical protein
MYPDAVADEIRNDPALELFAHRVPLTPQRVGAALSEKQTAIKHVSTMIDRWEELEPLVSRERYQQVLTGLEDNLVDAKLWEWSLRLYLRYKLGELTREELAQSLATIREDFPRGGSRLSSGESLERFLGEWQAVLDGTFKRRVMEGKHYSPPVDDFPPGLAESR